ncbi:MAG: PHP domain-containing protein [Anaerolineae bacterium]|nr:PHP domain-containing protein [Anaerolineae bacterium]
MKLDLHVHTLYSPDSLTPLEDVLFWAKRHGLDALAITDHNTIEGALRLYEMARTQIIVGEEIRTQQGEITGLYLTEEIPPGLSCHETIARIRVQNGIVYVPHPVDRVRSSAIGFNDLMSIIDQVDIIEVLNARVTFSADNRLAYDLARAYRLSMGAGSDAHQGYEIGQAFVEMPGACERASFLTNLARSHVGGRISSPLVHVGSTYAKAAKELRSLSLFAK